MAKLGTSSESHNARPFLRWAGGKTRLVCSLEDRLPQDLSDDVMYFEPFLGAGSLFFRLRPQRAQLSDNNKDLIECYEALQDRPDLVVRYLKTHLTNNSEEYYYKMRGKYNKARQSFAKAALFVYLNKTCFNGIWRVNSNGEFNVPFGHRDPKHPILERDILQAAKALSNATIIHCDYKDAVTKVREDDFVYFDPPYPPLNGTSYFTHYTIEGFNRTNHAELASVAKSLDRRGAFVMVSNADLPYIRKLYEGFRVHELEVMRWIRADGDRYRVREVIITNYD